MRTGGPASPSALSDQPRGVVPAEAARSGRRGGAGRMLSNDRRRLLASDAPGGVPGFRAGLRTGHDRVAPPGKALIDRKAWSSDVTVTSRVDGRWGERTETRARTRRARLRSRRARWVSGYARRRQRAAIRKPASPTCRGTGWAKAVNRFSSGVAPAAASSWSSSRRETPHPLRLLRPFIRVRPRRWSVARRRRRGQPVDVGVPRRGDDVLG